MKINSLSVPPSRTDIPQLTMSYLATHHAAVLTSSPLLHSSKSDANPAPLLNRLSTIHRPSTCPPPCPSSKFLLDLGCLALTIPPHTVSNDLSIHLHNILPTVHAHGRMFLPAANILYPPIISLPPPQIFDSSHHTAQSHHPAITQPTIRPWPTIATPRSRPILGFPTPRQPTVPLSPRSSNFLLLSFPR